MDVDLPRNPAVSDPPPHSPWLQAHLRRLEGEFSALVCSQVALALRRVNPRDPAAPCPPDADELPLRFARAYAEQYRLAGPAPLEGFPVTLADARPRTGKAVKTDQGVRLAENEMKKLSSPRPVSKSIEERLKDWDAKLLHICEKMRIISYCGKNPLCVHAGRPVISPEVLHRAEKIAEVACREAAYEDGEYGKVCSLWPTAAIQVALSYRETDDDGEPKWATVTEKEARVISFAGMQVHVHNSRGARATSAIPGRDATEEYRTKNGKVEYRTTEIGANDDVQGSVRTIKKNMEKLGALLARDSSATPFRMHAKIAEIALPVHMDVSGEAIPQENQSAKRKAQNAKSASWGRKHVKTKIPEPARA
jgi:hypothetical protein